MPTFRGYDRLLQLSGVDREVPPIPQYISKESLKEGIDNINSKIPAEASAENQLADKNLIVYKDVYIGVDAAYTDIVNENYHHDSIVEGTPISFDSVSGYIWAVLPERYTPVVAMSLAEVPMTLDGTITIGDNSYKVWKSEEEQTGTFNLYLF